MTDNSWNDWLRTLSGDQVAYVVVFSETDGVWASTAPDDKVVLLDSLEIDVYDKNGEVSGKETINEMEYLVKKLRSKATAEMLYFTGLSHMICSVTPMQSPNNHAYLAVKCVHSQEKLGCTVVVTGLVDGPGGEKIYDATSNVALWFWEGPEQRANHRLAVNNYVDNVSEL